MKILVGIRLTEQEVRDLLEWFDDSSDIPLHVGLDFDSYSRKLSENAHFVSAIDNEGTMAGFIAYYLNEEGHFVYVPQVVVHKSYRRKGIGHRMFEKLSNSVGETFTSLKLEVLKDNTTAKHFYEHEGFTEVENRDKRMLLEKDLQLG